MECALCQRPLTHWKLDRRLLFTFSFPGLEDLLFFVESGYNWFMDEASRQTKKLVIAIVFFLIVGGIGFLIYRSVVPPASKPTPNPTINLAPIQVVFTKLFNVQNNDYDFLAKVSNSNTDYGSGDAEYVMTFYNSSGQQVSTKTGSFYILPGQTKYVIDSPLKFQEPISRADFKITSVDWQKLDPLATSGTTLLVKNVAYSQIKNSTFAKAGGEVFNGSDFDLNKIDVSVVLLDQTEAPVAVNTTRIDTFLARTTRGFEVTWFVPFVGQVNRVDAEAATNVFENSNFLRQYGGQEKFKQLY